MKYQVTIGLDFGTYQTKACARIQREGQAAEYYFVPFMDDQDDEYSLRRYFRPSVIRLADDDTFWYGADKPAESVKEYSFFKIASAEDEEFRFDLDSKAETAVYDPKNYEPFTPEFLAVCYLADTICYIRQHIKQKIKGEQEQTAAPRSGFLGRFFNKEAPSTVNIDWAVQMGVPTEYQQKNNLKRKRKFQQILLTANKIASQNTGQRERLQGVTFLREQVQSVFDKLKQHIAGNEENVVAEAWKKILAESRLSVFPETAAGLYFLVRTNKLSKGQYYLSLDIGGGSTDMSFFKVEHNETFTYLASKSVMLASNNILKVLYSGEAIDNRLREKSVAIYDDPSVVGGKSYKKAFGALFGGLNTQVYKMFNTQVYRRFPKLNACTRYQDSICYMYGGGSKLPVISPNPEAYKEKVLLHDNGNRSSLTTHLLTASIKPIEELTIDETITPVNWSDGITFLIVALGLSLEMSDEILTSIKDNFYDAPVQTISPRLFDIEKARWV